MAQLKCLCGNTYSKTVKELEAQVSCPDCGWSVEVAEQERYFARAAGEAPESPPEPLERAQSAKDAEDSEDDENGD